jgi:hypothetical protein
LVAGVLPAEGFALTVNNPFEIAANSRDIAAHSVQIGSFQAPETNGSANAGWRGDASQHTCNQRALAPDDVIHLPMI